MSWRQSPAWLQKTFKNDAVRVAVALNRKGIDCTLEHEVVRYGQFRNGHPLSYSIDVLVTDPRFESVGIEMEGDGSSSRDNLERDAYMKSLGITLLHFKNSTKSQPIIDLLNAEFRRKDLDL